MAGIQRERQLLSGLRDRADRIIDTTALTVHQLRDELNEQFRDPDNSGVLTVLLVSFGYKFGVPTNVDTVLDARFLANPFFVVELRPLTGRDAAVSEFVLDRDEAREFVDRVEGLLDYTLPLYRREGKSYFTVAVGCTGGRHRSVALVERFGETLGQKGYRVQVQHRDIQR